MATITEKDWKRIEDHFGGRPCEMNEGCEIVFKNTNFPVGYIATDPDVKGYFVDTTGDRDRLIFRVG